MLALGVPSSLIGEWISRGYLYRRLPGVYAVGHAAPSIDARLSAALLWAGPGAMLSHTCGAWWYGLVGRQPKLIELSTPRHVRPRAGIRVHGRSDVVRTWHRRLPVAPVDEVLLQFATTATHNQLRKALAEAEYQDLLDLQLIQAACGRGRAGSAKLRAALSHHLPQLAVTQSEFENRLVFLCETYGIPFPEFDLLLLGFQIDAIWRERKLIVELDGKDGHAHWSRIKRDHHRDLVLRRAGFATLRYVWDQFENHGQLVAADIQAALG